MEQQPRNETARIQENQGGLPFECWQENLAAKVGACEQTTVSTSYTAFQPEIKAGDQEAIEVPREQKTCSKTTGAFMQIEVKVR